MNIPLSPFSSCPATVCSLYTLRLNLVLTRGIPPDFRGNVHLFVPRHTPSGQSRANRVAQLACRWLSLPRVRRHRASGPQGSLVPLTSAAFIAGITIYVLLFSPTPTIVGMQWACYVTQKMSKMTLLMICMLYYVCMNDYYL